MDSTKRYHWRVSLELKLRRCNGDSFQDFFSNVMAKCHDSDFVRVRPFGKLGDKGCDGYLLSTGQLFQCYGPLNAEQDKVNYLTTKMGTDFGTALIKLPAIMKEWHMVHNLVDGLPVHAVETLNGLKIANPSIGFGFLGIESLEKRIFSLPDADIEDLLGPAASHDDEMNLRPAELSELINTIVIAVDVTEANSNIQPVPADKLSFNKLPVHWHLLISGGWQNAHLISKYFEHHHDPLMGEKIARSFHDRYLYLKSQKLPSSEIMTHLYEGIIGKLTPSPQMQVVAQALLAYLFESCDIFEDAPYKVKL